VAGAEMLAQEARRRRRLGGGLYFWRLQDSVRKFLGQGSYLKDIGEGGFFPVKSNITAALYNTLDPDVCRTCKARIFKECHGDALPDGNRRLRLMLATDGSEYSRAPREVALSVAQRMGVTMDVMTMVPPDAEPERAALRLSVVHEEAEAREVRCEDVVIKGTDPAKAVLDAVQDSNCQLLVIGRTPPEGRTDRMVGTHAARIIDESPSNILVVPKDGHMWQKRILVGYDANPSAVAATELATMLAKYSRVPVTLVTAAKENHPARPVLEAALNEAVEMMRLEGIDAEARLVTGSPAEVLLRVAQEIDADLVILGKRHGGLYRLLPNSPTDRLIGANRWPILIAKAGRANQLEMVGTRA